MAGAPKRTIAQSHGKGDPALSSEDLAAAFDHAPVGIAVAGEGAIILRANAALAAMLGYQPAELTGKSLVALTHPDDLSDLLRGNERLLHDEASSFSVEQRYFHKTGRIVWARVYVSTMRNASSQHLLHAIDITQQKDFSARLRDTETRLQEMADAVEEAYWILNLDPFEFLYSSSAATRIWGFDPMLHRHAPQLMIERIHPDDLHDFLQLFDLGPHASRERQYRIVRPEGEVRWARTRVFPILNPAGTVYRLTGVTEDVTARKETQLEVERHRAFEQFILRLCTELVHLPAERIGETLERSLGELALMIDADRAALFVIDTTTNLLAAECSWSREGIPSTPSYTAFAFAPGNPMREQLLRDGLLQVDDVNALPESLGNVRCRLIANGIGSFIHLPLVRRGNLVGLYGFGTVGRKTRWPADVAARLAIAGEVFSNAIEREQMEAEVRKHRDALAHALRVGTMGQLASGLAHELNQPLAAIMNYSSAIDRRIAAGSVDSAWVREAVRKMGEQAVRAGDVIRTLRSLIRKSEGARVWQDPHDLVQTAVRFLEPELIAPGISIVAESDGNLSRVQVDTIQIEQVIMNLVRNAIDAVGATPERTDREIRVTTRALSPTVVELRVSDNGPGVAPENIDHLFDEFFTTKQQGLGLGLSISRAIVESHGGTLQLHSTSAAGTTFAFTLPSSRS